jgi:hypothetical protein
MPHISIKPFLRDYIADFALDIMGTTDVSEAINQLILDHKRAEQSSSEKESTKEPTKESTKESTKEADEDKEFNARLDYLFGSEGTRVALIAELSDAPQSSD